MLILHRMTQLGVMTQKRPEIWVSYPKPHEQALDMASMSIAIGDHILNTIVHDNSANDDLVNVSLGMGDHKLYFWGVSAQMLDEDNTQVSIAIGDHKLYEE